MEKLHLSLTFQETIMRTSCITSMSTIARHDGAIHWIYFWHYCHCMGNVCTKDLKKLNHHLELEVLTSKEKLCFCH